MNTNKLVDNIHRNQKLLNEVMQRTTDVNKIINKYVRREQIIENIVGYILIAITTIMLTTIIYFCIT